jgi:antagonist of KipI
MCIEIEKEGVFSSIQGLGSYGLQRFGINPRGAMDRTAVRILNALVGNPQDFSTIEFHFPAGEIRFTEPCLFAIGGADFSAELDGRDVPRWRTVLAAAGQQLRFTRVITGNRCYLAAAGGLAFRSPNRGALSVELTTERLYAGNLLRLSKIEPNSDKTEGRMVSPSMVPLYSKFPSVRFLPGGEFNMLDEASRHLLSDTTFDVSSDSNRMGFRLIGPRLVLAEPVELISSAVNFGTMQLLPDGQVVVLMADHQTSGGYPRIGNIISTDLPLIGQLGPGDKVAFAPTTIDEAERAALELDANLRKLEIGVSFGRYW